MHGQGARPSGGACLGCGGPPLCGFPCGGGLCPTAPEDCRAFLAPFCKARPGCSEHETGLAIDLGENVPELDFIRPSFPDTGICGTFRARAAEFGFILRYPKGKEAVTGIGWEPCHFRYVGVPFAREIADRGLTLEEYLL